MDQEDGERREREERLNMFLWPPPNQGTRKTLQLLILGRIVNLF